MNRHDDDPNGPLSDLRSQRSFERQLQQSGCCDHAPAAGLDPPAGSCERHAREEPLEDPPS
jgi:hypothetical protein